jgi:hypothetical protein
MIARAAGLRHLPLSCILRTTLLCSPSHGKLPLRMVFSTCILKFRLQAGRPDPRPGRVRSIEKSACTIRLVRGLCCWVDVPGRSWQVRSAGALSGRNPSRTWDDRPIPTTEAAKLICRIDSKERRVSSSKIPKVTKDLENSYHPVICYTGWWFGTLGLFSHMLRILIPTDELIFFRGVGIPPTGIDRTR